MKVVINRCYGGFGLSEQAILRLAQLQGIQLFRFVEQRDSRGNFILHKFRPYVKGEDAFFIHHSTKPLNADGSYVDGSYWSDHDVDRTDPLLIQVVEELGAKANGWAADLKVVEIPPGVEYEIDEYDGIETIHEQHRSWA